MFACATPTRGANPTNSSGAFTPSMAAVNVFTGCDNGESGASPKSNRVKARGLVFRLNLTELPELISRGIREVCARPDATKSIASEKASRKRTRPHNFIRNPFLLFGPIGCGTVYRADSEFNYYSGTSSQKGTNGAKKTGAGS